MTEPAVKTKQTATLLKAVYKNVRMASDSILNLMPKVRDERLKNDMTVQLSAFDAFASRAAKLLGEEGVKPEEEGMMTRMSAKMGAMMNTMRDSTSTHLAEMLVEGATMGVNDMLKQMREAENSSVGESALRLARDVCAYEEKIVRDMREAYLR
ncbi:MAG: hypothetical protein IKA05_07185 [Clostridia bacterium]|nr:hypothetical protein [Clostridia bacterium]